MAIRFIDQESEKPVAAPVSSKIRFLDEEPAGVSEKPKIRFLDEEAEGESVLGTTRSTFADEIAVAVPPVSSAVPTPAPLTMGLSSINPEVLVSQPAKHERTFMENVKESWRRGDEGVNLDREAFDAMMGLKPWEEVQKKRQAFKKLQESDQIGEKSGFLENSVYGTAAMLPPMLKGIKQGAEVGLASAAAAGIAGAMGPQIAAEPVIMPAAFAAGNTVGQFEYWARQGTGQVYGDLREAGVSHDTAKVLAPIGGLPYAAIEFSQVDKIIPGLGRKAKVFAKQTLMNGLLKLSGRVAKNVATESLEEAEQQVVTDTATAVGKYVDGQLESHDIPEEARQMAKNAWQSFYQSLGPMGLLQLPGATVGAGRIAATPKKQGLSFQTREFKQAAATLADAKVPFAERQQAALFLLRDLAEVNPQYADAMAVNAARAIANKQPFVLDENALRAPPAGFTAGSQITPPSTPFQQGRDELAAEMRRRADALEKNGAAEDAQRMGAYADLITQTQTPEDFEQASEIIRQDNEERKYAPQEGQGLASVQPQPEQDLVNVLEAYRRKRSEDQRSEVRKTEEDNIPMDYPAVDTGKQAIQGVPGADDINKAKLAAIASGNAPQVSAIGGQVSVPPTSTQNIETPSGESTTVAGAGPSLGGRQENVEHRTSNVEQGAGGSLGGRQENVEHRTSNVERPMSNVEQEKGGKGYGTIQERGAEKVSVQSGAGRGGGVRPAYPEGQGIAVPVAPGQGQETVQGETKAAAVPPGAGERAGVEKKLENVQHPTSNIEQKGNIPAVAVERVLEKKRARIDEQIATARAGMEYAQANGLLGEDQRRAMVTQGNERISELEREKAGITPDTVAAGLGREIARRQRVAGLARQRGQAEKVRLTGTDYNIYDLIEEMGGMRPFKSGELVEETKALRDRRLLRNDALSSPDEVAMEAHNRGLIKEPTVDALVEHIRNRTTVAGAREQDELAADYAEWQGQQAETQGKAQEDLAKTGERIPADINVGDTFTISGVKNTVQAELAAGLQIRDAEGGEFVIPYEEYGKTAAVYFMDKGSLVRGRTENVQHRTSNVQRQTEKGKVKKDILTPVSRRKPKIKVTEQALIPEKELPFNLTGEKRLITDAERKAEEARAESNRKANLEAAARELPFGEEEKENVQHRTSNIEHPMEKGKPKTDILTPMSQRKEKGRRETEVKEEVRGPAVSGQSASKSLAEMTPDEFKAQHVSERKETAFTDHWKIIERAMWDKKPVNAEAMKRYGRLPAWGYVREGVQWVFKGDQAATEPVARSPVGIKEAGAELTYNRRNRVARRTWEDIEGMNPTLQAKETTKGNIWPRPDYQAMITGGQQPMVVHLIKQVYDAIAVKPLTRETPMAEDFKKYVEAVQRVEAGLMQWANDPNAVRVWAEKQAKTAGASLGRQIALMDLAKESRSLLDAVYPDGWKNFREEVHILGGNKLLEALQPGYNEVRRAIKAIEQGWPAERESWQVQGYRVGPAEVVPKTYESEKGKTFYVEVNGQYQSNKSFDTFEAAQSFADSVKPVGLFKGNRMISSFDTEEQAREAAREATKRDKGRTISDKGISVESAERVGPVRRLEGEDISAQRLIDEFGFKGVNFGNWMKTPAAKAEAQLHLNHAYDALFDLAEILNVPPKALSLNGMLGLAIGAQGSGGAHAAHFVPGVNEINLTRTSGAGSLAHEWGHALDHYFATQGGLAAHSEPFLSEHTGNVGPDGQSKDGGKKAPAFQGLRPEIAAAFKTIVDAMNKRLITEVEVAAQVEQRDAESIKQRDRWLDAIRRDFTGQEAEFDKLADRVKKGDIGAGRVAVSSKTYLSPVLVEMRELTKQKKGRLYDLKNLSALQSWIDSVEYRKAHREEVAGHVPQTVSTDYSRNALKLDKEKGGKRYWSTDLEKFARAFDAYVSDRLETKAAKNTYLSHQARGGEMVPQGTERTTIDKAFDTLVGEIKTRETEKGVEMFSLAESRRPGVEEPLPDIYPVHDIGQAFEVLDGMARIVDTKKVVFYERQDQISERMKRALVRETQRSGGLDRIEGWHDQDTIHIVLENIRDKAHLKAIILHETFHRGIRRVLGEQESLNKVLDGTLGSLGRKMELAHIARTRGYNLALVADYRMAIDELIAKITEERTKKPNVFKRLVAVIRQQLREMGLVKELTDGDIDWLVERALAKGRGKGKTFNIEHRTSNVERRTGEGGGQFSLPELKSGDVVVSGKGIEYRVHKVSRPKRDTGYEEPLYRLASRGLLASKEWTLEEMQEAGLTAKGEGQPQFSLSENTIRRDYEAALKKPPVAVTQLKEGVFGSGLVRDLREKARLWALTKIRQAYKNLDTGWDIEISRNSINKALSGRRDYPTEHIKAIGVLPELLKNAVLVYSYPDIEKHPEVVAIRRFYAPLRIGDQIYSVKLTIKEKIDGHRFYDHSLTEIEKPAGVAVRVIPEGTSLQTSTASLSMINVEDFLPNVNEIMNEIDRTGIEKQQFSLADKQKSQVWLDNSAPASAEQYRTILDSFNNSIAQEPGIVNGEKEDISFSMAGREQVPAFYSQLGRVLEGIREPRVSIQKLKGIIGWYDQAGNWQGKQGVKQDEVFWTGLEDFIKAHKDQDVVKREDVLAAMKPVEIKEVVKGEPLSDEESSRRRELYDKFESESISPAESLELDALQERFAEQKTKTTGDTKFASYQTPGGENYRELLLTLPISHPGTFEQWYAQHQDLPYGVAKGQYERAVASAEKGRMRGDFFQSSHFPEPNILVHVRFNERLDAEGKRVLFIEEIQSDWHQGRRATEIRDQRSAGKEKVPPAPFSDTSKGWARLAMKRMIRWACEQSSPGNVLWSKVTQPESIGKLGENIFGREFATAMSFDVTDGGMLSVLHHDQVRKAVIAQFPVDVMDIFSGIKMSPNELFRNPPMVFENIPVNHRVRVATGVIDAMRQVGTTLRAKLGMLQTTRGNIILLPAIQASDLSSREVAGFLSPQLIYHTDEFLRPVEPGTARPRTEQSSANLRRVVESELDPTSLARLLNIHTTIVTGKTGESTQKFIAPSGFEKIAWTTGEMQAARYDLSKQVDSIGYETEDGGKTFGLTITRNQADITEDLNMPERLDQAGLEKYIGKEMAGRIVEMAKTEPEGTLEGESLKIGGAGMNTFYDRILPQIANDIGKRFGARVGETKIGGLQSKWGYLTGNNQFIPLENEEKARAFAKEEGNPDRAVFRESPATVSVPTLDLTPALRESVLYEGQPQFSLDRSKKGDILPIDEEVKRAYDAASVDEISGQPSLIIQRKVPRDVALQVAAASRAVAQAWSRYSRNQSDTEDNRNGGGALDRLERDVTNAVRQKILPLIDLARFGIDPDVNLDSYARWKTLDSTTLDRISGYTGEGIVFATKDEKFAYKLWIPWNDRNNPEKFYGAIPVPQKDNNGRWVEGFHGGTLAELLTRIAVHNQLGGIPTEITGVTDGGIVITKQPYAGNELRTLFNPMVRSRSVEIPGDVVTGEQGYKTYAAVVDGIPYFLTDARSENFISDTKGRSRISDLLIGEIPQLVLDQNESLARIVEEATKTEAQSNHPTRIIQWSLAGAPGENLADAMELLEHYKHLTDRAAGTGYAVGRAEEKERLAKSREKLRETIKGKKATLKEELAVFKQKAKERQEAAVLGARIGERAKGRLEGLKEGVKKGMAIGFKRGENIGKTLSVEDAVKLSFQEMAKEKHTHYQDALFHSEGVLEAMEKRITGGPDEDGRILKPQTPDQALAMKQAVLKMIFGQERFNALRHASGGDIDLTLSGVLDGIRKELAKHYIRAFERLLFTVKPDRMLPAYTKKWNEAAEGLTPGLYGKASWHKAKEKYEELAGIFAANRLEQNWRRMGQRQAARERAELATLELKDAAPVLKGLETQTPRHRGKWKTVMVDKMGNFLTRALSLSGGRDRDSVTFDTLYNSLRDGEKKALQMVRDCITDLNKVLEKNGITEGRVLDMRTSLKPVTVAGQVIKMTDAERIDLAASWLDPENRDIISINGYGLKRRKGQLEARIMGDTIGDTVDMVNDVLKTLTPAEREIAEAMVRVVTAMGTAGNAVSVQRDGWARFTKGVYWPRAVDRSTTQQTIGKDDQSSLWTQMQNHQTLNALGFTKERREHTHPILIGDAFDTFYYHVNMMSRYSHLNMPTYSALRLLGDPQYGSELRTRMGTGFITDYRDMIQRVSGLSGYAGGTELNRWLDLFSRNAAVSILWYRPTSIIFNRLGGAYLATSELYRRFPKQVARFIARTNMPISLHTAHAKEIIEKLKANGYLWQRWAHDMSRVYTPLGYERYGELGRTKWKMEWRRMQEQGLRPMASAEMRVAVALFESLTRAGLAEEAAVNEVEAIIRTTQNPSSALDESIWYMKMRDSGVGGLFPFLGQPMASRNMVLRDWLMLKGAHLEKNASGISAGRKALAASIMALSANLVLEMAVRALFRALSRKPPDDDEKAMEKALLYRTMETASFIADMLVPGSGRGIDYIKGAVTFGGPRDMSLFGSAVGKVVRGILQVTHPYTGRLDEYDPAKLEAGVINLIDGAGMLMGGPTGGPAVYYRIMRNLFGEESPAGGGGSALSPAEQQKKSFEERYRRLRRNAQ